MQREKCTPESGGNQWIMDHALFIEMGAQQRKADRGTFHDDGRHGFERLAKGGVGMVRPWGGVKHSDWHVDEGLETHQPVECVLDGTGDTVRIFRAGEQQGI